MQYDPKLKMAMEEIKEILKKYDAAAVVVMHRPGFSEYLQHLSPSYSCAVPENGGIRFNTGKSYFPNKEERDLCIHNTSNMMAHFATVIANIGMLLITASEKIDETFGIEHNNGGHTSHDQQNN